MKDLCPGTIVAIDNGFYRHVGIVTDRSQNGKPMVISNSFRRRGVFEEQWNDFSCHQNVIIHDYPGRLNSKSVVQRARSRIGTKWNLFDWNCEHFVYWSHGLEPHSPQIMSLFSCVSLFAGAALLYRFSNTLKR